MSWHLVVCMEGSSAQRRSLALALVQSSSLARHALLLWNAVLSGYALSRTSTEGRRREHPVSPPGLRTSAGRPLGGLRDVEPVVDTKLRARPGAVLSYEGQLVVSTSWVFGSAVSNPWIGPLPPAAIPGLSRYGARCSPEGLA